MAFDPENPDKKFIRMVLHQAFKGMGDNSPTDIFGEAWCLRDVELDEYRIIEKYMLDEGIIVESGEPDYFKMTDEAESWGKD